MKKLKLILILCMAFLFIAVQVTAQNVVRSEQKNGFLRFYHDVGNQETLYVMAPFFWNEEFNFAVLDTNTAVIHRNDTGSTSALKEYYSGSTGGWQADTTGASTYTIVQQEGGFLRLDCDGAGATERAQVSSNDSLYHGVRLSFEVRLRIDTQDSCAFFVGFSDDGDGGNDTLQFYVDTTNTRVGDSTPLPDTCRIIDNGTNGFGFLFDTNARRDSLYICATNNDVVVNPSMSGSGLTTQTGVAILADTWYILRAEMNSARTVEYYVNGAYQGRTALTVDPVSGLYLNIGHLSDGTVLNYRLDVDYVKIWSYR